MSGMLSVARRPWRSSGQGSPARRHLRWTSPGRVIRSTSIWKTGTTAIGSASPRSSSTAWKTGLSSSTRSTGCRTSSRHCAGSSTGAAADRRERAGSSSSGPRPSTSCVSRERRWPGASHTSTWRRSRRWRWRMTGERASGCGCAAGIRKAISPGATATAWRCAGTSSARIWSAMSPYSARASPPPPWNGCGRCWPTSRERCSMRPRLHGRWT